MFDVGFSELVLLAIVALVVLGPEKLPHAARILGAWVGRIRRTVGNIQAEIEREVASQEMKARLDKEFKNLGGQSILDELKSEQRELNDSLRNISIAATGTLADASSALAEPAPASELPPLAAANPAEAETPPSLLAEAAPASVPVDGEKAYREWLESQRRKSADSNAPATPGNPSP